MALFNLCRFLEKSILHYAKGTRNFYAQRANPHKWGTVGSGLTQGSPQYRHFSGFPVSDPEKPEILKKCKKSGISYLYYITLR